MTKRHKLASAVRAALLASSAAAMALSVQVQAAEATSDEDEAEEESEKIVITGSRLQKQTYSSVSPLQIVTTEDKKLEGLLDASSIIQNSTSSAGQQIDLTFNGFVLDNGPGASTADLRGLGASRTLVLLNDRRLAPSGVEGAPSAPDLNLVPSGLIQQFEFLLDGASSVYGSDAVAGVVNAKLRKDFDGFEFDLFGSIPEQNSGEQFTLSGAWGKNFDRGFIGVGVEYFESAEISLADRRWTDECNKHAEIDENGNIRSVDLFYSTNQGQRVDSRGCIPTDDLVGRVSVPAAGSIYYTPGFSNGGWGNFSESSQFGIPVDSDGDGFADLSFVDYSLNGNDRNQQGSLFPRVERISLMSYGEYVLEGESNITLDFEAGYNKRNFSFTSGQGQLFPTVPANNPYNICNPSGINGVDCGLAFDALMNNPQYVQDVFNVFGCTINTGGTCDQTGGPLGAQPTTPIVAVRGDRNFTKTSLEQFRLVGGLTADLPWDISGIPDWQVNTYFSYTSTDGESSRSGVRQDRLDQSLNAIVDGTGNVVCVDQSNGCVPVNLFAPSLYEGLLGDFATQAERDFLFDSRDFDTNITQTLFHAFVSGSLAQWPAGDVMAGFGVEYRVDEIDSRPDDIARDGLFFGFFSDGGAKGDRWVREYFTELFVPLVADVPGAKELNLELSGRYTKDEFYPSANTKSVKLGWRPIDSLFVRGTYGTSYRAPNLRENFLSGSTGFLTLSDPCAIPDSAIDPFGNYDPTQDRRAPEVFQNCTNNGVDPLAVQDIGDTGFSTEVLTGGIQGIREERSTSQTYGFAWEQPFSNEFELTIGATWYDISINDTIISPAAQFIVNDCYTRTSLDSTFCSRITRDTDGTLGIVDQSFINRDNERARGVDVNINWSSTIDTFGTPVTWTFDLVSNHPFERSFTFVDEGTGATSFDDDIGEFGFPEWRANIALGARFGDWRITWSTAYMNDVEQQADGIDPFSDIDDTQGTGFNGDTCLGPAAGDVLCRDIGFAGDYSLHNLSVAYSADTWTLAVGVRNILDEEPPFVDGNEVLAINNRPIGVGYDLNGRTVFFNFSADF